MKHQKRFCSLLLSAALSVGLLALPVSAADGRVPEYYVDTTLESERNSGVKTQVSKGFVIASGVFQGDETGALNWDGTLTRAEATIMLVRLMGLDEEAADVKSDPSPFTDVPEWANGHINVAYRKGVSMGVGDGLFDPFGACGPREFITMLYRLTHLNEGTDFSWATAVDDFVSDVQETGAFKTSKSWSVPFSLEGAASNFQRYFAQDGPFTREVAADVLYFMLNFNAGPDGETLGDILSAEYGMSDLLLFNHSVRRTGWAIAGASSLTFENFDGKGGAVTLTIKDGTLTTAGSHRDEMTISLPREGLIYGESHSCGKDIPLPAETFDTSLNYVETFLAGYDEDGDPLYGGISHSRSFSVTCKDGFWSISPFPAQSDLVDYAYIYAYRSQAHWDTYSDETLDYLVSSGALTPELQALADRLTAGKKTDLEKADAICEWVATHIYYDNDSLRNDDSSTRIGKQWPPEVYRRRLAVCDGYANLTYVLMRAAGLQCYNESGVGEGKLHGWNVACLDGSWVVIDNTWDSPLDYEKTAGSGYQCRYDDPQLIWVWRTPSDIQEPGASRRAETVYFNMDHDLFYSNHTLLRDPVMGNRAVTNIHNVLG